ncbi:helix-turn-helix transcriptional regulator [Microvirga pudoricolor]|uniref:helix-turn-helix transcriptional regulator n=1 Tax=Microvirga pudoricolor TaxID=2778729 RepID=UPI00194F5E11|nr:LuxR family transcriptional regulator [Microvirga pudoricolor]MBM6593611.1 LuxR family transcriptional regulator [Microvirga pudoricolor]
MTSDPVEAAFEFIETCETFETAEEILLGLRWVTEPFGLTSFIVSGLPALNRPVEPLVLLSAWPREWFLRYVSQNYIKDDPVAQLALVDSSPFRWSKALTAAGGRAAETLLGEAREFGLRDGYCVPLYTATGWQAVVSFASATPIHLTSRQQTILNFLAVTVHRRLKTIVGAPPVKAGRLTAREREVLSWAAAGKSAWEIGCILTMAEKTAIHHLDHIRRKLDVANTTQAVAVALQTGELTLA